MIYIIFILIAIIIGMLIFFNRNKCQHEFTYFISDDLMRTNYWGYRVDNYVGKFTLNKVCAKCGSSEKIQYETNKYNDEQSARGELHRLMKNIKKIHNIKD